MFNKIIEENFTKLKKQVAINVKEACRTPHRVDQQRKSSGHIIIKTQMYRAKKNYQSCKGKGPSNIQSDLSELPLTSQQRHKTPEGPLRCLEDLKRCQSRLLYPSKNFNQHTRRNQIVHEKKTNLNNIYPLIQPYRGYQKENFNIKRITTYPKIQEIIYLRAKPKEGKHTHTNPPTSKQQEFPIIGHQYLYTPQQQRQILPQNKGLKKVSQVIRNKKQAGVSHPILLLKNTAVFIQKMYIVISMNLEIN